MKKILKFILILLPWFIGGIIFRSDTIFYKSLNKPVFAPPSILFPIIWTILYFLIALNIYLIFKNNNYKDTLSYNKTLLINYFSNQIFSFLFFTLKSPFLALIDTFIVFISSLFLYYESKELNKTSAKLLIPYIIWNLFANILIISIFSFSIFIAVFSIPFSIPFSSAHSILSNITTIATSCLCHLHHKHLIFLHHH